MQLNQNPTSKPPFVHWGQLCLVLRRRIHFFPIVILLIFHHDSAAHMGPGGFGAVVTVPTARIQQDGRLAIGFGYIPIPFALYSGPSYDNLAYFATVGFLPFLEVSLRGTHALRDSLNAIGDRMASVRVQLFAENHGRPAVVVGLQDLIAIQGRKGYFTAPDAVATKGLPISSHLNVETTLGCGVSIGSKPGLASSQASLAA